jgi:predicted branched-subunit amino acid permease
MDKQRNGSFRRGLRDTAPLVPAIGAFGVAFGVLGVQVGLAPWLAVLASILILSGSAQFALVALIPSGAGAVLTAATGLALRHVPMSARTAGLMPQAPLLRRIHLAWILVDETFGLTLRAAERGEPDLVSYKTASDVTLYTTWILSTVAGAFLGAGLDPARLGLDVFFSLMFLGLAAPLLKGRRQLLVALSAVAASVGAVLVLPPAWRVSAAALVATFVGGRIRV